MNTVVIMNVAGHVTWSHPPLLTWSQSAPARIPRVWGTPEDGTSSKQLYWGGPWLVVYGRGPDSEDAGLQAREQCGAREVDSVLRPIDEIAQVRLDHVTGLVVVLPTQLGADPRAALEPFARLIEDYRARRPEGLDSLLNGRCEWYDAGVVQVVGQRAIMRDLGRTALDRACARHHTDDSAPLDVFQAYTTRSCVREEQPADDVRDKNITRLWCDVQAWGVTDINAVPKLRGCIDECRSYFENKRFPKLYRPIENLHQNRLDIILDGPRDVGDGDVGDRKTWMENGARVWRHVEEQLKQIVPHLSRPGGRDSTRDAQNQLCRLYRNLRIIDDAMHGGNGWDPWG